MDISMGQVDEKKLLLQSYFSRNGVLLCNNNKELPSLFDVGGDWNSIIALIEQGEVFYSKIYKSRVTYLSHDFYYLVKPYKQRADKLSSGSKELFEFINTAGPVNTKEIKNRLMLSAKLFSSCMDELFKELLVTAVQRDETMNQNWSYLLMGHL